MERLCRKDGVTGLSDSSAKNVLPSAYLSMKMCVDGKSHASDVKKLRPTGCVAHPSNLEYMQTSCSFHIIPQAY